MRGDVTLLPLIGAHGLVRDAPVDVGVVRALVEHPQVLAQRHQSRVSLTHSMTGMRQARVRGTTHSDRAAHGLPPSLVWSSVTALRPWRLIVALPPGPLLARRCAIPAGVPCPIAGAGLPG
jgi:hypothetical protein